MVCMGIMIWNLVNNSVALAQEEVESNFLSITHAGCAGYDLISVI